MHFRAAKESTKLCDLFIFKIKTIHLQQLKGMQSSKLVGCERDTFFIRKYTKGVRFLSKMVYKRVRGRFGPWGGAFLYKTFLKTPPPPSLPVL